MNVEFDIRDSKHLGNKQKYITVSGEFEGASKLTVLNLALRNKADKVSYMNTEGDFTKRSSNKNAFQAKF